MSRHRAPRGGRYAELAEIASGELPLPAGLGALDLAELF